MLRRQHRDEAQVLGQLDDPCALQPSFADEPLYIDVVVGGVDNEGTPYLANVDLRGRSYEDYVVATGFARHLAVPLVREKKPKDRDFTAVEASELVRNFEL